jgi:acyl-CoA hydrolase
VRVLAYFWNPSEQTLSGVVRFNSGAESHRGICHGGSMTSVLDDVLGHTCFMGGGGPWVGATVKLDVTLKAPVNVGATLLVVGKDAWMPRAPAPCSRLARRRIHACG